MFLGGNDWFKLKEGNFAQDLKDTFIERYSDLIIKVRNINTPIDGKDVPILVMTVGPRTASASMSVDEQNEISEKMKPLIESAVKRAGDGKGIYLRTINPDPIIDYDDNPRSCNILRQP